MYKIIKEEDSLKEFIKWLPDLEDGEKFYVALFARKKYDNSGILKADKNQLKRFVSDKSRLLSKIKQLEVEYGAYQFNHNPIPQDTLALYINPNPRSTHKASLEVMSEICKRLKKGEIIYNPHSISLNALQTTASRKIYLDIDIDFREGRICTLECLYDFLVDKVNPEAIVNNIIQTRGGFHILVELDKITSEYKKTWYRNITESKNEKFDIMMNSDNLIPVPGCIQGNFVPKIW